MENKDTKSIPDLKEKYIDSDQNLGKQFSIKEKVLQLRDIGLNAIPVTVKEKHPGKKGWNYSDKFVPESFIDDLIKEGADGVGVICGQISNGFIPFDFDNKDGANAKETYESFTKDPEVKRLIEKYNPPIESTPSGGKHILWRCSELDLPAEKLAEKPVTDPSKPNKKAVLIETRGRNTLIVIAPSPGYNITKGNINKIPDLEPQEMIYLLGIAMSLDQTGQVKKINPEELPNPGPYGMKFNEDNLGYILEWLERNKYREFKQQGKEIHFTRPEKESGTSVVFNYKGNNRLYVFSSSCSPLELGQSYSSYHLWTIEEHAGDYMKAQKALQDEYVQNITDISGKKIFPKTRYSPPPFPLDIFPESLQHTINKARELLNFPVGMTSAGILANTCTMIGNKLRFKTPLEFSVKSIVWFVSVAERGSWKSPIMKNTCAPLIEVAEDLKKQYLNEKNKWDSETTENRGKEPIRNSPLIRDLTMEGLMRANRDYPNGVLVDADEMSSLILNFGRYNTGDDSGMWSSLWNGESFYQARKDPRNSIFLDEPHVCIYGNLQPSMLQRSFDQDKINIGLLDRFQFILPDDLTYQDVSRDKGIYRNIWMNYKIKMRNLNQIKVDPQMNYCRTLEESEAENLFYDYYDDLGHRRDKLSQMNPKRGLYLKAQTMLCRYILVMRGINIAFNDVLYDKCITREEVRGAKKLVNYFLESSSRVYDLLLDTDHTENMEEDEYIFYQHLPDDESFIWSQAHQIAESMEKKHGIKMEKSRINRFLRREDLFIKTYRGTYVKK